MRSDLSIGDQAVQAIHAMRQFSNDFPEVDKKWFSESNVLALLCVSDELELEKLAEQADAKNIKLSKFYEEDLNNQLTAICLEPGNKTKKLCFKLKLALS